MNGVLVAGATGGIGAAVMRELTARGIPNVGVDRDTIDITEPGGAERAIEFATAELGTFDGVVHAIGMSGRRLGDGPIGVCTDEAWREVHRVNHESVFRLLRAAVPALAASGGGSVAVVGSALAKTLDDEFLTVAYASAKAALLPLVRSSAYVGAADGVRVNLVSPGVVDTPMARRAVESPELGPRLQSLQRVSHGAQRAESVAKVVCWVLSDEAGDLSGAEIPADGGWTLR
ncbi:NAD(P)-dependent dehydrogenase (short-subunit alcohol dehydrogenase family) [Nakamurella sp. UYEF19]|uniref:SDR family NAD(P)-dependent oxidoreductase n=1 Tax=Nakamurella sp. UYEF19 TaxID=1756392 RepID=UPI003394785F